MTETQQQGVMAMVKIDGAKVKLLREQKGLTQLYVATVVQVTTDTISRWENKRYPTIKKENGLRLAEALEVDLSEFLEAEPEEDRDQPVAEPLPASIPTAQASNTSRPAWLVPLLVFAGIVLVLILAGVLFLSKQETVTIQARRILPLQCTVGEPFPVTIQFSGPADTPLTIIVKEQVPEEMTILKTEPLLPSPGAKNNTLKWLEKTTGRSLFTYIARISQPLKEGQALSGSVATSNSVDTPVIITGPDSINISNFHWADSDGNNVISDQEILTVYDQYGDLEKLGIDIDLIEEIWLGSGYRWNSTKNTYEILP